MSAYPYQDRFPVNRALPEHGRPRDEIVKEMAELAAEEDTSWESGRVSGTMYCGDHDHYEFMNEVFGLYAHVNILQRDICPSATRYEGEVLAMALDLFNAGAVTDGEPAGLVTSGGTGSICHAVLAYREKAAQHRGVTRPNFIKPETGHPAFDKACHLFGIELRRAPVDPVTTLVDVDWVRANIDDQTIGMMGSACNYGYGTIDPIEQLSDLALEKGIPLHVDGCLGGFILPFGQELGYPNIPVFDFRLPGVTSISADTHKYGYAFKGTSTVLFRDKSWRNAQYFFLTDWTGGKYCSPGMDGSRSGGLLAATWAAMVQLGREGYRKYARRSSIPRWRCRKRSAAIPSCASWATRRSCSASRATSSTSTTSTTSCVRRAGDSTASSTPTRCTWPSPVPRRSPVWSRRSPPTWPTRSPTPRRRVTSRQPRARSTAVSPVA
jgi:glutamate/tyrosine decarboxylase-like PLP-dependent enzyme